MKQGNMLMIALCGTFLLAGCNTEKTIESNVKEDLIKIEESVKKDVTETENYSKEKIKEAVSFIQENIDKLDVPEKAKKVYEYGLYLEEVSKKEGITIEHDIMKYASTAKEYAADAIQATENELSKISEEAKTEMNKLGDAFETEKEKLIDDFYNLLNK